MSDLETRELERQFASSPDTETGQRLARVLERAGEGRKSRAIRLQIGEFPSFVTLLVEHERHADSFRLTRGLVFGDSEVSISIQAGPSHYCSDRSRVILPYDAYTLWEVGFQRSLLPTAEGVVWENVDAQIDWEDPSADWSVGGYVPTASVQALVEWLYVEYGDARSREPNS